MSEYTPSLARLRDEYVEMRTEHFGFSDLYAAEFDRALQAHDAQVRAEAVEAAGLRRQVEGSFAEAMRRARAEAKAEALEEAAKAGAQYAVNPWVSRDYQEGASHADIYWQLALERAAAAIRTTLGTTETTNGDSDG